MKFSKINLLLNMRYFLSISLAITTGIIALSNIETSSPILKILFAIFMSSLIFFASFIILELFLMDLIDYKSVTEIEKMKLSSSIEKKVMRVNQGPIIHEIPTASFVMKGPNQTIKVTIDLSEARSEGNELLIHNLRIKPAYEYSVIFLKKMSSFRNETMIYEINPIAINHFDLKSLKYYNIEITQNKKPTHLRLVK